jgi:hypothetical protein
MTKPTTHMFNAPRIVWQTCDDECCVPETAIGVHYDATPLILLEQNGQSVLINIETVPELIRVLKEVRAAAVKFKDIP